MIDNTLMNSSIKRFVFKTRTRRKKMTKKDFERSRKDNIYVIKIGGSAFDLIEEDKKDKLGYLGKIFKQIANAYKDGYKIVLTCGAGPWGDASKQFRDYFKNIGFEQKPELNDIRTSCDFATKAIDRFLIDTSEIAKSEMTANLKCRVALPDALGLIFSKPSILDERILAFYSAPITAQADYNLSDILEKNQTSLPQTDSDTHTILIADWIAKRNKEQNNAETELIFIKDTKGVYDFDPNRTDIDQETNEFHKKISIEKVITSIDRTGTDGRGNHLIETTAGKLFEKIENITAIRILNAKEPARIRQVLYENQNRGSIIYNNHYKNGNGNGNKIKED